MTFECDVFISYAHIDNLSLKEGEPGWVTNFHKALEIRLAQLLGERPSIWRDQKLQGNDFFGDEIVEQFPKTAVMISILSPRYIKSEWCTREVREFTHVAEEGLGKKIGNKSRVFKVIKTQIPLGAQPSEIADTLGYEFYVSDPNSGRIKELDPKIGGDLEQFYWAKLDDIAHDICNLLENLKQTGETGVLIHEEQLTVYLAETGSDLREQREAVKRELEEYGYRVVPDTRLPYVDAEFKEAVANFLEQSVLSIHLMGSSYGMVPEGSRASIIELQNEVAVQKSKGRQLPRLIWVLPDISPEDERQEQFLRRVRTDDGALYGADIYESTVEEFKSAVQERLDRIKKADTANKVILPGPEPGCVFLAETTYDLREYRENIKRRLTDLGYNVVPKQPLPLVYDEFADTVDNLLEQCEISIHLVGEGYGVVPDKTKNSVVHIQYERSEAVSRKTQLKRHPMGRPDINRRLYR